jgi:DNA-binding IclR family transcriptional regulator
MRPPVNSSAMHIFQTLRLVCTAEAPLNHAEISRRADLPSTTVYRALGTLEEAQYVQRSQTFSYEAGIAPQLLIWTLLKRFPLATASLPFLARLSELSGETVSLCGRLGWYGVRLAVVYGGNDIYHRDRIGEISLLHADLSSRGIFAFLSDDNIECYRRFVLRHHEAHVRQIDRPALRREVQAARKLGYLSAGPQSSDNAASLAIPIQSADGNVVASIVLSGPSIIGAESSLPASWREICNQISNLLHGVGKKMIAPFAHLDPDDIVLKLPPIER